MAQSILGKTGALPGSTVATVREITAETGVLRDAEFTSGTGAALLESTARQQAAIANEILGLRRSADDVGALLGLGWTGFETRAIYEKLVFWWRLVDE